MMRTKLYQIMFLSVTILWPLFLHGAVSEDTASIALDYKRIISDDIIWIKKDEHKGNQNIISDDIIFGTSDDYDNEHKGDQIIISDDIISDDIIFGASDDYEEQHKGNLIIISSDSCKNDTVDCKPLLIPEMELMIRHIKTQAVMYCLQSKRFIITDQKGTTYCPKQCELSVNMFVQQNE